MQFNKLMLAMAALAAGSAMATTPDAQIAISSGASASKNNLKLALASRCTATLAEYTNGTANVSTYVCATGTFSATPTAAEYTASTPVNFTNTLFAELRLNVNGGSFTAVCLLAGFPGGTACPPADLYKSPADAATPATLSVRPATATIVGGLMDVEPTAFLGTVRSGIANPASVISAGFGQTFGVAVSDTLYAAMFTYQQGLGLIPATCAVGLTAQPECVPVIGKAQMATIMSSNAGNAAYVRGANFLVPTLPNPTAMTYARRVDTSGTQAAAQQFFLTNVCGTAPINVVAESASSGAITVTALPTTGGVRGILNTAATYAIGIMSGENAQSESWRWLRVGGMQMAENATPNLTTSNTASALDGRYDYWFLSRIAKTNVGVVNNFWTSVTAGFGAVPVNTTRGLFRITETAFTKGSTNSCLPVTSN